MAGSPTTTEPITTDMVIIGAGPVGLFTVFEAGLLGLKCHLVDNLDKIGGQCAELYPAKPSFDSPAVPRCTGQELIDRRVEQAQPFDPVFHLSQQATALTRLENGHWRLETTAGTIFEAPNIVIAAGAGSFVPRRIPLPEAEAFEGRSLFYAVRRMEDFRAGMSGRGRGRHALDWLLALEPLAASLTLLHRRTSSAPPPDSVARMRELVASGRPAAARPDRRLDAPTASSRPSGSRRWRASGRCRANALLAFFGLKMELRPDRGLGARHRARPVKVETESFETSQPGLSSPSATSSPIRASSSSFSPDLTRPP
jgi:thioredoxin reductase (NADPH)